MAVYLLHFSEKYRHAQHYLGFTSISPFKRYCRHLAGRGSPLVYAAVRAGIEVDLVKVWMHEDRKFERKLKNQKNAKKLCPRCRKQFMLHKVVVPTDGWQKRLESLYGKI